MYQDMLSFLDIELQKNHLIFQENKYNTTCPKFILQRPKKVQTFVIYIFVQSFKYNIISWNIIKAY